MNKSVWGLSSDGWFHFAAKYLHPVSSSADECLFNVLQPCRLLLDHCKDILVMIKWLVFNYNYQYSVTATLKLMFVG